MIAVPVRPGTVDVIGDIGGARPTVVRPHVEGRGPQAGLPIPLDAQEVNGDGYAVSLLSAFLRGRRGFFAGAAAGAEGALGSGAASAGAPADGTAGLSGAAVGVGARSAGGDVASTRRERRPFTAFGAGGAGAALAAERSAARFSSCARVHLKW